MAKGTVTQKIIDAHYVSGSRTPGEPVAIRIDQTLTQDATGTMAYLELEAMKTPSVNTELSVSYVDHNMMQNGPENRNDHLYLQTVAANKGVLFSPPGNGNPSAEDSIAVPEAEKEPSESEVERSQPTEAAPEPTEQPREVNRLVFEQLIFLCKRINCRRS